MKNPYDRGYVLRIICTNSDKNSGCSHKCLMWWNKILRTLLLSDVHNEYQKKKFRGIDLTNFEFFRKLWAKAGYLLKKSVRMKVLPVQCTGKIG